MKGFFTVNCSEGHYNRTRDIAIRADDVSAIEYGESDAYRGIAGVRVILRNGQIIKSTDDENRVRKEFNRALAESSTP